MQKCKEVNVSKRIKRKQRMQRVPKRQRTQRVQKLQGTQKAQEMQRIQRIKIANNEIIGKNAITAKISKKSKIARKI